MTRFWRIAIGVTLASAVGIFAAYNFLNKEQDLVQEATPARILEHVRSLNSPLVLINFWASWCEPCKVEFPHILQLRKTFAERGLKVVFVSVDDVTDLPNAEHFLKEQKVDFLTFFKGTQSLNFVSQILPNWSGAVPASALMGPDLSILDAWEGDTSLEEFEQRIQKQLRVK